MWIKKKKEEKKEKQALKLFMSYISSTLLKKITDHILKGGHSINSLARPLGNYKLEYVCPGSCLSTKITDEVKK